MLNKNLKKTRMKMVATIKNHHLTWERDNTDNTTITKTNKMAMIRMMIFENEIKLSFKNYEKEL